MAGPSDLITITGAGESLAEQAYRILERMIVTLKLAPGTVATEGALIELTGMGRTPVREAIQKLSWEGLMEIRPRSGVVIAPLDPKDITKVLDTREGVECVLARDAAQNAVPQHHERLQMASQAMKQAVDDENVEAFMEADKNFDTVLAIASANPFAARLAAPLQTHSRRFWFFLRNPDDLHHSALAHTDLIQAIVSRNRTAAEKAAAHLIQEMRHLVP
ncbi:MAG: GntR family transcriptional regulator [Phyllobacterium sp.]